jgi:DNA-binding protein H-NS
MALPKVDNLSLKDLLELEIRVRRAIAVARERDKSEAKQKVENMLKGMGLSFGDVFGGRGGGKGGKVAPKYRNPDNPSETWTGRGRQPRWLAEKTKKGAKIADFAI